ncbi:hypothetical protein U14_03149 [Candidatus Moduliflexus flocculans]|uniref:Glycosyltransferase RgtA/B/C/D-like domain-containing protein n=1 Tax=Candidatus Moduliflexus flocculans TaxID=1499966 RepID=A0A081BND7_9BACT|nr:hypothetical protein U14_03149 [Candidatus Moduliflexus flocculans]
MPSIHKNIFTIAVVAFLFRLLMFFFVFEHSERTIRPDTPSYVRPAINMTEGHGFSGNEHPPFFPSAIRTPIYPVFIAFFYTVFERDVLIIAFVQIFIDTLTAVLIYIWGRRLFSESAARLGGLIYSLSVEQAVHAVFILTESLFTLFFLWAIIAVSCYREHCRLRWLVSGGILIGIAILIRPIALFFPLIGLLFIWMASPNMRWQFMRHGIIFLLIIAGIVVPWVIRNYLTLGLLKVSSISSYNLLFYNAASLSTDLHRISQAQARAAINDQVTKELTALGWKGDELHSAQLYTAWSRKILFSAPIRYVYIHLKNDINCFLPDVTDFLELIGATQGGKETLSVLNQHGLIAAVNHYFDDNIWLLWAVFPFIALLGVTYLGTILGISIQILQKHWDSLRLLFLPAAYLTLLPGAAATPRFRVPAMPYICLLAGIGIAKSIQCYKIRQQQRTPI